MVLIIHGFPNMISALRFEWAWTKPTESRRLRYLQKKKNSEKMFAYKIRVLSEMLRIGPWNRLPLTIRWLKQDYMVAFDPHCLPPEHMPVEFGPVKCTKVKDSTMSSSSSTQLAISCDICHSDCMVCIDLGYFCICLFSALMCLNSSDFWLPNTCISDNYDNILGCTYVLMH